MAIRLGEWFVFEQQTKNFAHLGHLGGVPGPVVHPGPAGLGLLRQGLQPLVEGGVLGREVVSGGLQPRELVIHAGYVAEHAAVDLFHVLA